jgi:hypothetical protein
MTIALRKPLQDRACPLHIRILSISPSPVLLGAFPRIGRI